MAEVTRLVSSQKTIKGAVNLRQQLQIRSHTVSVFLLRKKVHPSSQERSYVGGRGGAKGVAAPGGRVASKINILNKKKHFMHSELPSLKQDF